MIRRLALLLVLCVAASATLASTPVTLVTLQRNGVNVVKDVGCKLDDPTPSVATSNRQKINTELAKTWASNPVNTVDEARYALVLPAGELFIDSPIVMPARTSIYLIGQGGLTYQLGSQDYSPPPGIGGRASRITSLANSTTTPVIEMQGSGGGVSGICIQGRLKPTDAGSGSTNLRCNGIQIDGLDNPPTGKFSFNDITFVDCTHCFEITASPGEVHADESVVQNCAAQGFSEFVHCVNQQAVGWHFSDLHLLGDTDSIAFNVLRGGDWVIENCLLNTPKITLLRVRDFSQNTACFDFSGVRYDTPVSAGRLTLVDFNGSSDFTWRIRIGGNIAAFAGSGSGLYPANELIRNASGTAAGDPPSGLGKRANDLKIDMLNAPFALVPVRADLNNTTLSVNIPYTHTGGTGTATMPTVSGNLGRTVSVKNAGSGTLTIQRAGSDNIYTSSAVTSIAVAAGASVRLECDGTYWNQM